MITTNEPASVTGHGAGASSTIDQAPGPVDYNFDFTFAVDSINGNVDLVINTLLGQRLLFGKFSVSIDQVSVHGRPIVTSNCASFMCS